MSWEVRTKEGEVVSSNTFARGAWHIHHWIEEHMEGKHEQAEYKFSKQQLQLLLIDLHNVQLYPCLAKRWFPIPEGKRVEEHYYFNSINELAKECSMFLLRFDFHEDKLIYKANW